MSRRVDGNQSKTTEMTMITTHDRAPHRRNTLAMLAICAAALTAMAFAVFAPAASAQVKWTSEVQQGPSHLAPGGKGLIRIILANGGDTDATEFPTVSFELPTGVTINNPTAPDGHAWTCAGSPVVTCTNEFGSFFSVHPNVYVGLIEFGGDMFSINVPVDVAADAPEGTHPFVLTTEGGGAGAATTSQEITVAAQQLPFGITPGSFEAGAFDENGDDYTQAGGHPYEASASFELNRRFNDPTAPNGSYSKAISGEGGIKDVVTDLPAGFIGNPSVGPKCPDLGAVDRRACPATTQVGVATVSPPLQTNGRRRMFAVYNVVPAKDVPAQFAFHSPVGNILIEPVLRSDGDMGLSAQVHNITQTDFVTATRVTLWGVPADPSHDAQRCANPNFVAQACVGIDEGNLTEFDNNVLEPHSSTAPVKPFLSNPTACSGEPVVTSIHVASWENPASYQADGDPDLSDPDWDSASAEAPPVSGCDALDFAPSLVARPTTNAADSPTGLEVKLSVPQSDDPEGLTSAHLKDATVILPEGLVVNPSSANGLGACSPAQVGLTSPTGNGDPVFDKFDPNCPDAAKVGVVEVDTPLLPDPLRGAVFVGTPHENPFGSLLSIYIVVKGPGLIVKLAGKVTPDPQTGRLTAVVKDNPQVPFDDFKLNFFGGAAASLKTPATCGTYSTTSSLTPWSAPQSGPPATPSDTYEISQAPGGGACASSPAQLPNAPAFESGSASPLAGNYSPFVVNLRREDGSQQFSSVTLTPPQGLVAKLAGTATCPDSALSAAAAKSGKEEQGAPSCPAASEVGNVIAGAGAGPAPYYANGKAYLTGPYKGAPLSLAIVTPAVAGPFDLGTIVVRTALYLDSKTAQITAKSDPIPTILQGIPLDVRSVSIRMDKPGFTLNPTSCDPSAVTGSLLSTSGAAAALDSRFQLAECGRLGFKPQLKLSLKGGTKRSRFPALTAVMTPRAGDANIASVSVAFPPSEFLAQSHIRTVCTRVQFAADQCPAASIYGTATVTTPLLDYPLTGPVYLRSSSNELPDLVPDFRGPAFQPIRLEAAGRTDSINGGIRNSFDFVPDAPFTKLVLKMQGGKKGLLENSRDICAEPYRATVKYGAHNGASFSAKPVLKAQCGKARKGKGKQRGAKR